MGTQIWGKVHNFGIYRKGGKRCILQLDFPSRVLLVIQKGHIKKTHSFDALQHYDSEEGLHVSLKFSDGEIEFEADNTEEKYTVCRLLGYMLQMSQGEDDESIDSGQGLSALGEGQADSTDVIKDGLLEKKGHTTITTWNKRRVKLTPGEFSYYKPGEELALNIIQLWQDHCTVKKHGQNGFSVTVRDRVYSFRIPSEYKAMQMTEIVRNEWFEAFQQAVNQVPIITKIFEQPMNGSTINNDDSEPIYDVTPDTAASASNRMQLPANKHSKGEITAHVTVHLNYIDKALPTPPLSSFGRCNSMDNILSESNSYRTETGLSDHPSLSAQSSLGDDQLGGDGDPFSGSAADFRAKLAMRGGKSSSLKSYRAEQEKKKKKGKGRWSSQTKTKGFVSDDSTLQIRHPVRGEDQTRQLNEHIFESNSSLTSSSNDLLSEKPQTPAASKSSTPDEIVKKFMNMPPPPLPPFAPPAIPHAPPPPMGAPPPPPLLLKGGNSVKLKQTPNVKLKQVYWVKVNNNQISSSMWHHVHDMTDKLDLSELEEQFCIQEKKPVVIKTKSQEDKQMLIDAKRAQNLGILFCGLKTESLTKLCDALNSTTEVESFPADKMATLKRYQPTTEDREMYKLYADKRDTLHAADCFLLELCEIPSFSIRLDLVLTLWEFPDQYKSLEEEVNDLLSGCEEVLSSNALTTILEYLLAIGNYMNSLWNSKQGTQGFQLSSIDKVLSVRGRDSQTTLCTYLVKQLKQNQPELLDWVNSMDHVAKCAEYSVKAVGAEIDVLKNDLQKIKKSLKTLRTHADSKIDKKFLTDVQNFIVEYDRKMVQLDSKYSNVTDKYKEMLVRFGEQPNKITDSLFASISLLMEKFQLAANKVK